jgi:hypothetical protein
MLESWATHIMEEGRRPLEEIGKLTERKRGGHTYARTTEQTYLIIL